MAHLREETLFLNRYAFEKLVAEGGSARVYRVRDTWLPGRRLIAKVQRENDPRLGRALQREFATLLLHPPINAPEPVLLHRAEPEEPLPVDNASGLVLIETEVTGLTWHDWLKTKPRQQERLIAIATLLKSLHGLHNSGLRHGDIKPDNILIPPGTPIGASWIDFGLSDAPGVFHGGTPDYLAPEALDGKPTFSSDLFAFGKLLETLSDSTELRRLSARMTSWNPNERPTAAEALEEVVAMTGEFEAAHHLRPINPWALKHKDFRQIHELCRLKGSAMLCVEGQPEAGPERWVSTAIAGAVRQGWDLISTDALRTKIEAAQEDPTIEDWAYFVVNALAQRAQARPLIVDAGQRTEGDPIDLLNRRFSREFQQHEGIIWLCWCTPQYSAPHSPPAIVLKRWSQEELENLTRCYRPELVHPKKVAHSLERTSDGWVALASAILCKSQTLPEPSLWNLEPEKSNVNGTKLEAFYALQKEAVSLQDAAAALLPIQDVETTRSEHQQLIASNRLEPGDASQTFRLRYPAILQINLDLLLSADELKIILDDTPQPLVTPLLPSSHSWQSQISVVAMLESAAFHHKRREWLSTAACYEAVRSVDVPFEFKDRHQFADALVQLGHLGQAIAVLESCPQASSVLRRADLLAEQGLSSEAAELLEHLNRQFPSVSCTLKLSKLQMRHGKFREAEEMLRALESGLDLEERVERETQLALIQTFQGRPEEGIALLQERRDTVNEHVELHGKVASALALILQKSGRVDEARLLYQQSIECAEKSCSTRTLLNRLTNLGTLEQNANNFGAALDVYKRSQELANALNNRSTLLRSGLNLANLYASLGLQSESREILDRIDTHSEGGQFTTERTYIELLKLDLELSSTNLPLDFSKRVEQLRSEFKQQGLETALLEVDLLDLKSKAYFEPTSRAVHDLATWVQARVDEQLQSLAAQGHFALIRSLVALGDLSDVHAALEVLTKTAAGSQSPEIQWSIAALNAISKTQLRSFEEAEAFWKTAKEAHSRLLQVIPSNAHGSFFNTSPRTELRQHQQEFIQHAVPQGHSSLPSVTRLFQIMRALAQETDTQRLLNRILDTVVTLSGAERGLLILSDADDQSLQVHATSGVYEFESETRDFSTSIAQRSIEALQPIRSDNLQGDGRFSSDHSVHILNLQSTLCLPLHAPPHIRGALYLDHRTKANAFEDADVPVLWAFADQAAVALANAFVIKELSLQKEQLETTQRELSTIQRELQADLTRSTSHPKLSAEPSSPLTGPMADVGIVTADPTMLRLSKVVEKVAPTSLPVTITGESGTGKELIARAIHVGSEHQSGEFIALNCGAVSDGLWESELFGHERGAFTGASRDKPGLFELAHNGTIFLDEIGDLPLETQVKLLRVLQQGEFRRVGGHSTMKTNARVVCATHRSLSEMVREGRFREDLWYRLNVIELHLPALRDRPLDIPILVTHFLKRYASKTHETITDEAQRRLLGHPWPGNIRQLENEIQRALALSEAVIDVEHLSDKLQTTPGLASTALVRESGGALGPLKPQVEAFEREYIERMLDACDGNRSQTAKALGLTRPGFYKKLRTLGMK